MSFASDFPVKKIKVVFSKSSHEESLSLFQFPLRSNVYGFNESELLSVSYKPKADKFQIVMNQNNIVDDVKKTCGEKTIASDTGFDANRRYLAGKMINGVLHVRLVDKVYTFRPLLKSKEVEKKEEIADEKKLSVINATKIESEEARKQRMKSYTYLKKIEDEENWNPLNVVSSESDLQRKLKATLFHDASAENSGANVSISLKTKNFMDLFLNKSLSSQDDVKSLMEKTKMGSFQSFIEKHCKYDLCKMATILLYIKCFPVSACEPTTEAHTSYNEELTEVKTENLIVPSHEKMELNNIFYQLNQFCVCIHGHWMCTSETYYTDEKIIKLRNYILVMLFLCGYLPINDSNVGEIPTHKLTFLDKNLINEIMEPLAYYDKNTKNWFFKYDAFQAEEFYSFYVATQTQIWRKMYLDVIAAFDLVHENQLDEEAFGSMLRRNNYKVMNFIT